ncbi:Glycosyltransferase, GT2 family [Amycolatopsis marina]|uniref:Glycosyltransferase, GT2 family n=1 Tax=Amycolatopsis marina TaxID=490629 RepID=A0A1I1CN27_9PSEU|nr:glycosyltransferase [Amycolatopsis marina]SFB63456.1 Glycosyltransferase, GT2 family [Amycolatopsis marina]
MPPSVPTTVVVVTWRGTEHITACLDALAAQNRPHQTLVVDNASDDGTAALLAAHPSAPKVLRLPRNAGYAGGIAAALSVVDTEYMAWLNDDAEPGPSWLAELEDGLAADPGAAAVGSVLELADGTPQSFGVRLTADGHGADLGTRAPAFGFCGGAVLLRTSALRAAGGVAGDYFCYYEDTDTAWRLRLRGWRIAAPPAVPAAAVRHRHGASTRPGSRAFHRWNERNRLLTLLRCAPGLVVVRELLRFAAITLLLPLRGQRPAAANFRFGLRCAVLASVLARLPATLWQRVRIGRLATVPRGNVWRAWAGT